MAYEKPQIWFDFDDTLCDWHKIIIPLHNTLFQKHLTLKDHKHHDYFHLYDVAHQHQDWEWLREQWRTHHCAEQVELLSGVKEMLDTLSEHFSINIVTARGWHPNAEALTHQTLSQAGIVVDNVVAIHYGMDKGQVLKNRGNNIIAFVEDTIKHCDNVHSSGLDPSCIYLIDAPWNQDNTTYQRLSHVTDLTSILLPKEPSLSW